tara:strand:- start:4128 stop:5213 length:1086 start_codon:yes stop_codon:yes gene_type:complete
LAIKLFEPHIDDSEKNSVLKTLDSKFWASGSGIGLVKKFENKFNNYINADTCIAVNSGTAALNIAVSLLDIKGGEVIIPSLSFVSTANCVLQNGGKPKFVDVNPKTLCIDDELVEKSLTNNTKAIIPVDFGGMPSITEKIWKLSREYKIPIIEDAAHAAGASYKKSKVGSRGFAVCFSFHPVKNLSMPTGGLIAINSKEYSKIRKKIEARRWCGITNRIDDDYDIKELGNNYYMNEISAAIGIEQLKKLNRLNSIRKKIAKRYHSELDIKYKMPFDKGCSYHLYWICVKNRTKFRKILKSQGVETGTHYKPIHTFSLYKNQKKLPVTERIGKDIVTIPIHPNLTDYQIDKIIRLINKFASS